MGTVLDQACVGAIAGLVATGPMTAFMKGVHATLPPDEQTPIPPREITERATAMAGVRQELSDGERLGLSVAAHFAFGATTGAVYGPLAHHFRLPPVAGGIAYGLGVWATSYLGWLPAAGLYRSPGREPAGRHFMIFGAHVVWGAVLGVLTDQLSGEDKESPAASPRRSNVRR